MRKIEWDTEITTYPTGETHARWTTEIAHEEIYLASNIRNWTDLMTLKTLDNAAKRIYGHRVNINWIIPYFPFARDDRRRHKYDANTLQDAISVLGDMADRIVVADPHSHATEVFGYVSQARIVGFFNEARNLLEDNPVICIPDEGARKKAFTWTDKVPNQGVVQGVKKRDPDTGRLSGFDVEGYVTGRNVVIIDDICDGGGTFLGLYDVLMSKNARSVSLGVTHGLFTNADNLREMQSKFKKIVCMSDDPALAPLNPISWMTAL